MKAQGDIRSLVFSHLGLSSKERTNPCALSDLFADVVTDCTCCTALGQRMTVEDQQANSLHTTGKRVDSASLQFWMALSARYEFMSLVKSLSLLCLFC